MSKKEKSGIISKISNGIDSFIGVFNPQAAFKRQAYRRARNVLGSYRGAERSSMRSAWIPGGGSADQDILQDLPTLREKSRDLNRNDSYASGITQTVTTNTVGTGIKPQCRVDYESLGITEEESQTFQKRAERIFERWVPYADAQNRMDFFEIQRMVDRQILENGEAIIIPLMINEPGRPFSLALDVIEADRLASPQGQTLNPKIRSGVEIGERGQPVGYWIKKTHPGDIMINRKWGEDDFIFYPAKNEMGRANVIHLYWQNRPGQSRGVPFFAPVLNYFKDMADYLEAELIASRIAACFSIFVKRTDDAGAFASARSSETIDDKKIQDIYPGMIEYLNAGEDIVGFNPNRPNVAFDPFIDRILKGICTSLGLSYEIVSKDFSKTNYSSARAAILETRQYFRMRQAWLSSKLCQPTWEMLLEESYLRGEIDAENFYEQRQDWTRARWVAPGWGWIDPVKEAESSQMSIDSGLSTLANEAAAQGRDWEENLEQLAREKRKIKELELKNGIELIKKSDSQAKEPVPAGAGQEDTQ